jgi:two-component system sensor histidine kinase SenX3
MLGLREERLPARLPFQEMLDIAKEAFHGEDSFRTVTLFYPTPRTVRVRGIPLAGSGLVLVLRDVTEEVMAQRIRREFVAHASHELKSPVAGMQTLADAIRQALGDDPETATRFSDRLIAEADRLGRLIDDLLDLSRLEDPVARDHELVDLSDVIRTETEQARSVAEAKHMSLDIVVDDGLRMRGDSQQLGLMVRNLLENAIRYTAEGGSIRVAGRRERDAIVLEVEDNGIGIPLEAKGRIFERFFRVDRGRSRSQGGTGLGLAIVKHVVEQHAGTVDVESELGRGSTFTIRLPGHTEES